MSHKENDPTSQEGAEDAAARCRADFLCELDASPPAPPRRGDIFLDDGTVSRGHADFRRGNGEFKIADISSPNRTCVNRERVLLVAGVGQRYPRW